MKLKLKRNSTKITFMKNQYPFLKECFVGVERLRMEPTVTDVPKYASADNIKIEIDMGPSSYSSKTQCNVKMEGGSEDKIADNEMPDQKDEIMKNELLNLEWIKIENGMEFKVEPIDLNWIDPSSYSSKKQCNEMIEGDLEDEIVDKELINSSPKIADNKLPDHEDEIVHVDIVGRSPELCEDGVPLSVLFNKKTFSIQEDSAKGRCTKFDPPVNLMMNDPSPERNSDLPDLEDKIIDVKTLDRSPELCEVDVPLSVLFDKNTLSNQEDSAKGRCTNFDQPVNLMRNDSILKKLLVMEGETLSYPTISSEPNFEGGLELNATCDNQPRIRSDCELAPFGVRSEHIFHNAPNSKTYKCTFCEASFTSNASLKEHILSVHERLRPLKCPSCDFVSSCSGSLSDHIRAVHDKLRRFNMPYCDYTCSYKLALSNYKSAVYEKLKQFKCLCCDYSCSKKSSLLIHEMFLHKKLKRILKCFSCNYTSNKKIDLLRHIQSSHKKILVAKPQSWPNDGLISRLNQETQTDRGLFRENKDSELLASRPTRTKQA